MADKETVKETAKEAVTEATVRITAFHGSVNGPFTIEGEFGPKEIVSIGGQQVQPTAFGPRRVKGMVPPGLRVGPLEVTVGSAKFSGKLPA